MKQILINVGGLETRVAVVEDGRLAEYFIERRDEEHLVGSIYKGCINNLEPSLQAAFVDIGFDKNAFLHYWDMLPATQEMLEDEEHEEESQGAAEALLAEEAKAVAAVPARRRGFFERLKQALTFCREEEQTPPAAPPPALHRRSRRPPRRKPRQQFTVEDIPNLFKAKSEVLVQVTKGPISNKGPRVTTNLSLPGRYLVLLPNSTHIGVSKRIESHEERDRLRRILRDLNLPPNMGVICRTVGAGKSEQAFQQDAHNLLECWAQAEETIRSKAAPCCVYQEPGLVECTIRDYLTENVDEIVTDSKTTYDFVQEVVKRFSREDKVKIRFYSNPRPLFHKYNLMDQIESIFSRQVSLPGGGHIVVDETEALIAIDVNSGRNRAGKDHPETIINTNLEAAAEVARQLRLRNVGGLIVIDFIDMRSRKDQQTVYRALKDALQEDRAKNKVLPISPLGLVEMTRQRERESLQAAVYSACPYCNGKGLVKSAASVSVDIQRRLQELLRRNRNVRQIQVTVHPDILERIKNEDADLVKAMEGEFRCEFAFRADDALHLEEFRIRDGLTGSEL